MRTAALTFILFVACGYAANAQRFSLLPQVGFENSKTSVNYNELGYFAPTGVKFTPQASLRLNYASKKGHGFFVGVASSRSAVSFSFADPETGMNNYTATTADMQLRMEGGYQFNSKPLYFNKGKQASTKSTAAKKETKSCGSYSRTSCSKSSASRCGSKSKTQSVQSKSRDRGAWVRLQPSAGIGFIPSSKAVIDAKAQNGQTIYDYKAGSWNTAVMAGTGFEFGRKNTRLFTVSINYFKGLGNLEKQTFTTQTSSKTTITTLDSKVSGWNLRVGIPFTLKATNHTTKNKSGAKKKSGCQPYKIQYRCRTIM